MLPKRAEKKIYFDYAATTPVDPAVARAMRPYFTKEFGNPGSLHAFGQRALGAIDRSREQIGRSIGAEFREIIFTGSATEANNLAIRGAAEAATDAMRGKTRMITSSLEHESVLETCTAMEKKGVEIVRLPVDARGSIDLRGLQAAVTEHTAVISIQYANNETGTIQQIPRIAEIVEEFRKKNRSVYPLFHTDAAQAFQFLRCDVRALGVDLMTLSSHKIYGPKGIGALFVKKTAREKKMIAPLICGGGQEFGLRSGTENTPLIAGFAKAVALAVAKRDSETERIRELRDYFWDELRKKHPTFELNGGGTATLPHILNVYIPHLLAEDVLAKLDLAGVAVSTGSACSARAAEPSHVIQALGHSRERAKRSVRISFGRQTTRHEAARGLEIFHNAVE